MRHQKQGLHFRSHLVIQLCHLSFAVQIFCTAQAPQHNPCTACPHIINQQSFKMIKTHIGHMSACHFQQFHPLCDGKASLLGGIMKNGNDHFIKKFGCTLKQIQMSHGYGIKAAGKNTDSFRHQAHSLSCKPVYR